MFILRKLTSMFLFVLRIFRRAFCCFRLRSNQRCFDEENDTLTHVGVILNKSEHSVEWNNEWQNDDGSSRAPQTIEEHIKAYRDKNKQTPVDISDQEVDNLFQELTPQVIPAPRVKLRPSKEKLNEPPPDLSRLAPAKNYSADLGEWIDEVGVESGWDEQHIDPREIMKQYKRKAEAAA